VDNGAGMMLDHLEKRIRRLETDMDVDVGRQQDEQLPTDKA
jgi:hypothetical protein